MSPIRRATDVSLGKVERARDERLEGLRSGVTDKAATQQSVDGAAAEAWAPKARPGAINQGRISFRNAPVEFGAEKEFGVEAFSSSGRKLEATEPTRWLPELTAKFDASKFVPSSQGKEVTARGWSDLNDAGKAAWVAAFRAQTGSPPILRVRPNTPIRSIDHEPDGSLEFVAKKMGDTGSLKAWLDEYGWGHVHTSFLRPAEAKTRDEQVNWNVMSNVYMFLSALERRNAPGVTDPVSAGKVSGINWAFAVKPLSFPTHEHVTLWTQFLDNLTQRASTFSKHLNLNIRTGMYENDAGQRDPARVGNEIRGGLPNEKERVLDSLTHSLVEGRWGAKPEAYGASGFRLLSAGGGVPRTQIQGVPRDFETMLEEHLEAGEVPGLNGADAGRLYRLVANARFYDSVPVSRLQGFDQRVGVPLLAYEKLNAVPAGDKARAVSARAHFIAQLSELEKQATKTDMPSTQVAQRISALVINWGKEARLAENIGTWLDGPGRRSILRP